MKSLLTEVLSFAMVLTLFGGPIAVAFGAHPSPIVCVVYLFLLWLLARLAYSASKGKRA